jgi:cell division protein FtsB
MRDRIEKKQKSFCQRIFYSQIVIFIGIIFIIIFSAGISKRMVRKHQIDKETEELKNEILKLEENSRELNKLLAFLDSNEFLEEEARIKMGLKKEGEQVAIINNSNRIEAAAKEDYFQISSPKKQTTNNDLNKSNLNKWFNYFFSLN